jgi:hypothetical protein
MKQEMVLSRISVPLTYFVEIERNVKRKHKLRLSLFSVVDIAITSVIKLSNFLVCNY